MKVRILGSGDAVGTPHVGCTCKNCIYAQETGIERLRTSLLITNENHHLIIDTTPDLRRQLLLAGSPRIDAVIWTHGHYDHFMGFGDFYRVQKVPPVYGAPQVLSSCSPVFHFLIKEERPVAVYTPFITCGLEIILVRVEHPNIYTTGVIVSDGRTRIGYTSDTNEHMPDETRALFQGVDMLFIDGLFPDSFKKVEKHLNYEEAIGMAHQLQVKDFRIVHMSHLIPFDAPGQGHDGEVIIF
ncbi:MAG TPA: MBL fold metallo-hydrolase [Methanospirillum sp.]|uniref:MBL fold metallo-hydrolase n=1 Tax=Methanospirillum sp. TaxID=45200 RepID=UPI002B81433E|nr:MBL fold metallo-hydrolase [Methanospirillum sp.]HOJ97261.1 MBL fold metallo-hydrolase [Methanospirillum sp.]HOL41244.1 MBL fold metallo-hydrolase [Methanospirillum sp.]HPP77887.1 MBL fold metallo-hydrolase [Methanospirillum sp.]